MKIFSCRLHIWNIKKIRFHILNMKKKYDAIIIGAGPAGLKCAETLAKKKKQVLVLEKNKQIGYKVCAGGLTLKGINLIPKKILQRKFKKLKIHTPIQSTDLIYKKPIIATLNRTDLHKFLAKQAIKKKMKVV